MSQPTPTAGCAQCSHFTSWSRPLDWHLVFKSPCLLPARRLQAGPSVCLSKLPFVKRVLRKSLCSVLLPVSRCQCPRNPRHVGQHSSLPFLEVLVERERIEEAMKAAPGLMGFVQSFCNGCSSALPKGFLHLSIVLWTKLTYMGSLQGSLF